ncbi:hypothetical protein HNQ96_003105 [Aminobacter lissarensis]|uniref:Uncharacterized protein n=1 Tax=Aminobacter carboxidus TaxID=376165 RepID=A0A8E2BC50_9HYPH|nr:hypothetical protein [Aminobacter lissarensis]MBB6467226.1 hypothetical protein [Aminobacter lissarensis]
MTDSKPFAIGLKALGEVAKFAVVALLGAWGIVLAFAALIYATTWNPPYDDSNPKYRFLTQQIEEIAERWSNGDYGRNIIDLTLLNDGNWTTACVYGGYNNPLSEMIARGATVSSANRARLSELGDMDFRLSQVEESEAMIAFVDKSNEAHFIHLGYGFGPNGQHLKQCTSRTNPSLELS